MPNIKPISDLRNYTDILKQVDVSKEYILREMVMVNMGYLQWMKLMNLTGTVQHIS